MIIILAFLLISLILKFLVEENLMLILLTMEFMVILSFFIIFSTNFMSMSISSCLISFLTIQISESVLSICLFVNLIRFYKSIYISSSAVLKL